MRCWASRLVSRLILGLIMMGDVSWSWVIFLVDLSTFVACELSLRDSKGRGGCSHSAISRNKVIETLEVQYRRGQ